MFYKEGMKIRDDSYLALVPEGLRLKKGLCSQADQIRQGS